MGANYRPFFIVFSDFLFKIESFLFHIFVVIYCIMNILSDLFQFIRVLFFVHRFTFT
jgi:hypothetical protein